MEKKKQSSIEWFLNEFSKQIEFVPNSELDLWYKELIPKAKAMHKEEIIESYTECNMYNRTEHAKELAQSLIDSFLVAQFGVGDMKAHRLLAIESSIVAIDFFLNKSRKGDDYDYGLYEECRSQLIVLRQGCL